MKNKIKEKKQNLEDLINKLYEDKEEENLKIYGNYNLYQIYDKKINLTNLISKYSIVRNFL